MIRCVQSKELADIKWYILLTEALLRMLISLEAGTITTTMENTMTAQSSTATKEMTQVWYDYSSMFTQPCNSNEFDFIWDNINIRVVINREYFKDTDHVEIYCSKPNKYTVTAYKSHFFRESFTEEEIKSKLLDALGEEPQQQSLF